MNIIKKIDEAIAYCERYAGKPKYLIIGNEALELLQKEIGQTETYKDMILIKHDDWSYTVQAFYNMPSGGFLSP